MFCFTLQVKANPLKPHFNIYLNQDGVYRLTHDEINLSKHNISNEFSKLKQIADSLGFSHVASGPLVRSSYHADLQAAGETIT